MSFTKIDSYLSYELGNNQVKIRITDKYFAPYRVITDVLDLLSKNNLGDKRAWTKLSQDLYKTSKSVKNSGISFPLELSLIYKEEEFIIF
jgi:hypothetical protein